MDYQCELFLNPLVDYTEFYEKQILTDCEIRMKDNPLDDDYQSIKAHSVILANASKYFLNVFTGNTSEAQTGIVEILTTMPDTFQKVIRFMYNGKIEFQDSEIMQLLHIAGYYEITPLEKAVKKRIERIVNDQNVLNFADQCFQNLLVEELKFLEQYFIPLFEKISTQNFTKYLDVITYTHILKEQPLTDIQRFKNLNEFMGDFKCDDEEKAACAEVFRDKTNKELRQALHQNPVNWLPSDF